MVSLYTVMYISRWFDFLTDFFGREVDCLMRSSTANTACLLLPYVQIHGGRICFTAPLSVYSHLDDPHDYLGVDSVLSFSRCQMIAAGGGGEGGLESIVLHTIYYNVYSIYSI